MGKKHSTFSPSGAERWLQCPASIELSKGVPQPPPSKYAIEGTDAHECLEFLIRRMGSLEDAVEECRWRFSNAMITHALKAIMEINSLKPDSEYAELLIEQRVRVQSDPRCYGTLDYAWVDLWNRLVVIDYKYGAGYAVEVISLTGELNPQLMIYATAVAEQYEFAFDEIELVIIQPRAREKVPQRISIKTEWVKDFRDNTLLPGIQATQRYDAPTVPGSHCRWCPAKGESCFSYIDTDSKPYEDDTLFDFQTGSSASSEESFFDFA